jgi:Domain of unknown function (DUF397)
METMNWRKSSYSSGNGGECVEVANTGHVMVRDTTDRDGGTLAFTTAAWKAFTAHLKRSLADSQPSL